MAAPTVSHSLAAWFASIIAALKAPLLVAIVAGLAAGGSEFRQRFCTRAQHTLVRREPSARPRLGTFH